MIDYNGPHGTQIMADIKFCFSFLIQIYYLSTSSRLLFRSEIYFPRSVATPPAVLPSNILGCATNALSTLPYREVYFLYHSTVVFNPSSHDISSFQPNSCSLEELIVYRKSLNLRSGT